MRPFRPADFGRGWRAPIWRNGDRLCGYNSRPRCQSGREYTEVARQMCPRSWHDRDQTLDDLVRREQKRSRSISPGPLEPQLKAPIVELGQPVRGHWRPCEVASHSLKPFAIVRRNAGGSLDVVALNLRAQLPRLVSGARSGGHAAVRGVTRFSTARRRRKWPKLGQRRSRRCSISLSPCTHSTGRRETPGHVKFPCCRGFSTGYAGTRLLGGFQSSRDGTSEA
jgi:hypothetical protein